MLRLSVSTRPKNLGLLGQFSGSVLGNRKI